MSDGTYFGGIAIKNPAYKWRVSLTQNTYLMQYEAPCWFHRKMQELCFGIKWEALGESDE